MRELLEGSEAVAEAVRLCKPGVVSAYPITPQTHIVEGLAAMIADGKFTSQFVNVESEHSAASVVLGSVATGVRSFTATSSQGLLLMAEVVFNIAGMRLPVIMTCANRAISAPLNIWNDHQDAITVRDSGWIQMHAENIQEALDLHIQAYRIGESPKIMLPVMVNMDGFILTHGLEVVDVPTQAQVDSFLPAYTPLYKLDVNNPLTFGPLVDPDYYMEARYAIHQTHKDVLKLIPLVKDEFQKVFGRPTGGLIEGYRIDDAEKVIVAMGSVCGTIKDVVDSLRSKGKKVGLLKIITYRPFPADAIYQALKDIPKVAVLEKAVSLGSYSPVLTEIRSAFSKPEGSGLASYSQSHGKKKSPVISGFVIGLGGRDITIDSIKEVYKRLGPKPISEEYIDLKPELLEEHI
ncbi:MAG: pyruvate ferredoxin oxidoreductase [Omnitrophica WOR_2 bacterium GWF2_43_52]|nr:MAG: pyruvate ferredoxin oxidoreductase [Omnitrophica WOR_2 bacterium GWA2_44_7]OGX20816.1 MAG: pyruvate ferredoxin oxidoreductase [Omnitrophica WOR_2 bacterium GWF2_43_52]HAH19847.1 pyruvate ferredoxin oxidoreductase [Candidatus Omnitrophota bacterium]HBG63471.1 pyruvate ferredoxin oxidoreductase [Candidatus Omnitrophota bacterium]